MKFTALATALALVSAATPAVAAPRVATTSASALSVANAPALRASTPSRRGSGLTGALENPAVSLVLAVVAVGGILLVAGAISDDDAADSN